MEPIKITDNPVKLDLVATHGRDSSVLKKRTFRGLNTKIDVNVFDGYLLENIQFNGVVYTREDALRMAEFFQVHAYCLRSEKDL